MTANISSASTKRGHTKSEIKNMVAEFKKTKSAFFAAERTDQIVERGYAAAASFSLDADDDNTSPVIYLPCHEDQLREDSTLVPTQLNDQQGAIVTAANLMQNQHAQFDDNQQFDFLTVESLSDDFLLQIAWHIRAQKIVASYALAVLEKGYEAKDVTSFEHHGELEAKPNTRQSSIANGHQGTSLHSSQDLSEDDEANIISNTDERWLEWNESEGDSRRARTAIINHSTTHVHQGKSYLREMPRDRSSDDRQRNRVGTNSPGASESPCAFGRPRSRLSNDDYYLNVPQPHRVRDSPTPFHDGNYTTSPFGQSQAYYGTNDKSFGEPCWRPCPPLSPAATESSSAVRGSAEEEAMEWGLAGLKWDQERVQEETKRRLLEIQIRKELEKEFAWKEQVRKEEEEKEAAKNWMEEIREEAARKEARRAIEAEVKMDAEQREREYVALQQLERKAYDKAKTALQAEAEGRKGIRRIFLKF
jgi:hypothetical protein